MPSPIALKTSDPRFAPRWEPIPGHPHITDLYRQGAYYGNTRGVGSFEIVYALVDEQGFLSPWSPPAVVNTTVTDWDVIVRASDIPPATRAIGTLWAYRAVGSSAYLLLGGQQNTDLPTRCVRPFVPLAGWDHSLGGFKLWWVHDWPSLSDPFWCYGSSLPQPPAPSASIRCLPCVDLEIAVAWEADGEEGPLSQPTFVPALAGWSTHSNIYLFSNCIPPQACTGKRLYIRHPGGPWHRQQRLYRPSANRMVVDHFEETGILPAQPGQVYLDSIHLGMRDWNRDLIIDTDFQVRGPVVSEFEGNSYVWNEGQDQSIAWYFPPGNDSERWTLTVDGITTDPLKPMLNASGPARMAIWQSWIDACQQCYGDKVSVTEGWGVDGPVFTFQNEWGEQDMTSRFTFDFSGLSKQPTTIAQYTKPGKEAKFSDTPWPTGTKFNRTISTSNGGIFRLSDKPTGVAKQWPLWIENSQRTHPVGMEILLNETDCGIDFCDHTGGGAFHFSPRRCSVGFAPSNPTVNTYGIRCTYDCRGPSWNNHTASELYSEGFYALTKFPIVVEGGQAANWTFWNTTIVSTGGIDSAIITQGNAGIIKFLGRITVDNAHCILAATEAVRFDADNLWLDQGMPCWFCISGNTFPKITIRGNKVNQWASWLHVIEMPAGSFGNNTVPMGTYKTVLNLSDLDCQPPTPLDAKVVGPGMSATAKVNGAETVAFLANLNYTGYPVPVVDP